MRDGAPWREGRRHPLTHNSPLLHVSCVAHAFDKDGHLLEAEPDCPGAGLAVMLTGQKAAALGNQAQDRVQLRHDFRDQLFGMQGYGSGSCV